MRPDRPISPLKSVPPSGVKTWPYAGRFSVVLLALATSVSFAAVQTQATAAMSVSPVTSVAPAAASAHAEATKIAAAAGDNAKLVQSTTSEKLSANLGADNPAMAKAASQSKPLWTELTPAQQVSLKPLAANWGGLTEAHKRKWIAFAQNYPKMSPADQSRLHSRMTEWVTLSPQQRTQARLNFAESKKLTADEKAFTWQAYQALSAEEKKRLASQGNKVPPGATSAIKPVPAQKLAIVPSTRKDPKSAQIAAHQPKVAPNTLLPQQEASQSDTPAPKH